MNKLSITIMVTLTLCSAIPVQAQLNLTFQEIFKQKKTELKYLSRQIAELQLYIGAVKKGYNIVQSGLGTIQSIKKGEFNVHDLFYTSQYLVSSAVRSMPAAKKTIENSRWIHRNTATFLREMNKSSHLTESQRVFVSQTCHRMITDVDNNINHLQSLLASGALQMDDKQRMEDIQQACDKSTEQMKFASTLFSDARLISISRQSASLEIQLLRNRYDLQNPKP